MIPLGRKFGGGADRGGGVEGAVEDAVDDAFATRTEGERGIEADDADEAGDRGAACGLDVERVDGANVADAAEMSVARRGLPARADCGQNVRVQLEELDAKLRRDHAAMS